MCQVILNKIFSIFKEIFFSTKLMLDRISEENCDDRDMITKHFPRVSLDAPAYTPWFDTWMKYYLQTLPVAEHEFLKHSLGCIFVVSTRSDPELETNLCKVLSFTIMEKAPTRARAFSWLLSH